MTHIRLTSGGVATGARFATSQAFAPVLADDHLASGRNLPGREEDLLSRAEQLALASD
jgi:hypothetical protein